MTYITYNVNRITSNRSLGWGCGESTMATFFKIYFIAMKFSIINNIMNYDNNFCTKKFCVWYFIYNNHTELAVANVSGHYIILN